MNTKTPVSVILGLFVVSSIVYSVIPKSPTGKKATQQQNPLPEVAQKGKVLVAYYFYDSIRCQTCIKIESLTGQVLKEDYSKELASGSIVWKPIKTDDAGNEHFLKDYKIMTKSVVLSQMEDGKQVRWSNLAKVWELIKDDASYKTYVRDEVAAFMRAK
jgi:hypothetical protein